MEYGKICILISWRRSTCESCFNQRTTLQHVVFYEEDAHWSSICSLINPSANSDLVNSLFFHQPIIISVIWKYVTEQMQYVQYIKICNHSAMSRSKYPFFIVLYLKKVVCRKHLWHQLRYLLFYNKFKLGERIHNYRIWHSLLYISSCLFLLDLHCNYTLQ